MDYKLHYPNAESERIDKYVHQSIQTLSRSYVQQLIDAQQVTVNGEICRSNYRCKPDDCIKIHIDPPKELQLEPENIPLDIVYEDDSIIIVNKPKHIVVHPAAGHESGTLVNALLYHCGSSLSSINGVIRPGIVHRIDQDTTGLLVICKNDHAHKLLAEQLKTHSITRKYHAICIGNFKEEDGVISAPIGRHPTDRKKMAINHRNGRTAVTHYHVIEQFSGYSYIECTLETGRTHQIRVHMSSIQHPILGDTVYGPKKVNVKGTDGQTLHAKTLGFIHPDTGQYVEYDSPLPEYFLRLLETLRSRS